MKKVISFSVFRGGKGKKIDYVEGFFNNCRVAPTVFPGWEIWVTVGKNTITEEEKSRIKAAADNYTEFDDSNKWAGLIERYRPAGRKDINYFIVRDTDSSLCDRDKVCVDKWIESGKDWLSMRDNPAHSIAMVGDMWGCKGGLIDFNKEIDEFVKQVGYQRAVDQKYMCTMVWPRIKDNCIQFDSVRERTKYGPSSDFPKHIPIDPIEFVGQDNITDKHLRYYSEGTAGDEAKVHREMAQKSKEGIVEIGVLRGDTSRLLLKNSKAPVWGIDPIVPDSETGKDNSNVDKIKTVCEDYKDRYEWIKDFSYNVVEDWDKPFDYIFIDGDHQYEAVKKDFEDWFPKLSDGGFVAIHDSARDRGGPYNWKGPSKLCSELLNDNRVKYIKTVWSLTLFQKNDN